MLTQQDINSLPELLTVNDLIRLGVFHSHATAHNRRADKTGPQCTKVGNQFIYKRSDVVHYLKMQTPVKEVLLSIDDRVLALEIEFAKLLNHIN